MGRILTTWWANVNHNEKKCQINDLDHTIMKKNGSSVQPEEDLLYMSLAFSFSQVFFFFFQKFLFHLSFWIPFIRIFIILLYFHIDYLNPTFGGLRLHSQDFCLISNILVRFCLAIRAVPPLFTVISSLMQLEEWLSCI